MRMSWNHLRAAGEEPLRFRNVREPDSIASDAAIQRG